MKDGTNQAPDSNPFATGVGGTAVVATQTNEPTANPGTEPTTPQEPQPVGAGPNLNITPAKKSSPLKWILLIGLPILLIIICVLVWYFVFFNNKYNVVRQALYSMMDNREDTSKYDIAVKNSQMSVTANGSVSYLKDGTMSGDLTANLKSDSMSFTLPKFWLATDGKNGYFKVKLNDDMKKSMDLGTMDNQWLKVDLSSTANTSNLSEDKNSINNLSTALASDGGTNATSNKTETKGEYEIMQQCYSKAADKLSDKTAKKQIADSLLNTNFLVVNDSDADSNGQIYKISLDSDKTTDFVDKFMDTDYFKTFNDCIKKEVGNSSGIKLTADNKKELAKAIKDAKPKVQIWVAGFNRQVNKISLSLDVKSDEETTTVSTSFDFAHTKPNVTMPKDAVELEKAIQENPQVVQSLMGGLLQSQAGDSAKRDVSQVVQAVTDYTANNPGKSLGSQVAVAYENGQKGTTTLSPYIDTLSSNTSNVIVGPVTANPAALQQGTIWVLTGGKCDSTTQFSAASNDKQYVVLTKLQDGSLYCQDAS